MGRNHMNIPYADLLPCDLVAVNGRGLFPAITRVVTGRKWFDRTAWTHVGLVVEFHGQYLVAEMLREGLVIRSMEHYNKTRDRIVGFYRCNAMLDESIRQDVQKQIAKMYRRTVEYDWKGLLEFVSKRVKDNKRRLYCSEMVYQLTKQYVYYPRGYGIKVSPEDLRKCGLWTPITKGMQHV